MSTIPAAVRLPPSCYSECATDSQIGVVESVLDENRSPIHSAHEETRPRTGYHWRFVADRRGDRWLRSSPQLRIVLHPRRVAAGRVRDRVHDDSRAPRNVLGVHLGSCHLHSCGDRSSAVGGTSRREGPVGSYTRTCTHSSADAFGRLCSSAPISRPRASCSTALGCRTRTEELEGAV